MKYFPEGFDENKRAICEGSMTQRDILDYYVAIKRVKDNLKKKKLLEWLPKPKFLYHSSQAKGIERLTVNPQGRVRQAGDNPQVYGSPSPKVASMFSHPADDTYTGSGSFDGGEEWFYVIGDVEKYIANDEGGATYSIDTENFSVEPERGLDLFEWTSDDSTDVLEVISEYESSLKEMIKRGVSVYIMTKDEFSHFNESDMKEFLGERESVSLDQVEKYYA